MSFWHVLVLLLSGDDSFLRQGCNLAEFLIQEVQAPAATKVPEA
jgi:hypothetical protein